MKAMKEIILDIYKKNHSGKENAITRLEFISMHSRFGSPPFLYVTDRQFRQIYSQLPIVTCDKGGFYPIRKEEILEYRDYLRKKAIPLFNRYRQVYEAHLDLMGDEDQMELFKMEETI